MSQSNDGTKAWSIEDARTLYNIPSWGAKYFDINDAGHVTVRPLQEADGKVEGQRRSGWNAVGTERPPPCR